MCIQCLLSDESVSDSNAAVHSARAHRPRPRLWMQCHCNSEPVAHNHEGCRAASNDGAYIASRLPSWRVPLLPDVINKIYLVEFRKSPDSPVPAELVQIRNLQVRMKKGSVAFNCTFQIHLQGRWEFDCRTNFDIPCTGIATLKFHCASGKLITDCC